MGLGEVQGEERDRGWDFKELVHLIVRGFMRPKSDGIGWQAGDSGKSCSSSLKAVSWQNSFLLRETWGGGGGVCRGSTETFNWLDEAHPHCGEQSALLKAHQLNTNLIQKTSSQESPGQYLTKYLDTMASPSWQRRLNGGRGGGQWYGILLLCTDKSEKQRSDREPLTKGLPYFICVQLISIYQLCVYNILLRGKEWIYKFPQINQVKIIP